MGGGGGEKGGRGRTERGHQRVTMLVMEHGPSQQCAESNDY